MAATVWTRSHPGRKGEGSAERTTAGLLPQGTCGSAPTFSGRAQRTLHAPRLAGSTDTMPEMPTAEDAGLGVEGDPTPGQVKVR